MNFTPCLSRTRPRRWCARWLVGFAIALLLTGCAGVKVGSISPADYLQAKRGDILTTGQLSTATQEALRVIGTQNDSCRREPHSCQKLLTATSGLTQEQQLAALSELWIDVALSQAKADPNMASDGNVIANWLEAARFAYAYLFYVPHDPVARSFQDRQTQVRDYYNYAAQEIVEAMFRHYRKDHSLPQLPRGWQLALDHSAESGSDLNVVPEDVIPSASLTFTGLRNIYRRDGFGAELVTMMPDAARPLSARDQGKTPDRDAYGTDSVPASAPYREMPYPIMTAYLRIAGNDLSAVLTSHEAQLVLTDPYRVSNARIAGQQVPLAANFTAGYGLWLARSGFARQALESLLGRGNGISRPTIYLMQPYDPERRTIVLLHGLASSPEAWINVANEILGDATLRQHYQIWQVYYPTNAPLAFNNTAIRDALETTLSHFDPGGTAPASRNMTLIGHSMGGVLARLMVSSSGDTLQHGMASQFPTWLNNQRQAQMNLALSRYLHFDPLPQVSDVVFLAAPHRGTSFANNRIARWAANLVTFPLSTLAQIGDLTREALKINGTSAETLRIPNSIDNLSDRDPFVRLASTLPINPAVHYHSIMGNATPELPLDQSSDGIVPYASAHLDKADSELIVPSGHSVQEQPRAILEIRRILRQQLLLPQEARHEALE